MSRIRGVGCVVGALIAAGIGSAAILEARQAGDRSRFNGTWKLNAEASTNPNGPQPPGGRAGSRGGGGGGDTGATVSGGGGTDTGFTSAKGPAPGGALGAQEQQRLYTMLKVLEHAPVQLGVAVTAKDVTLTPDNNKPFHHATDGKKEDLPTGSKAFGSLEIRTKWDGPALQRTIKTIDGLTVIESYTLSPDGSQLHVSLERKSQIERLADWRKLPIERVYDRAQ